MQPFLKSRNEKDLFRPRFSRFVGKALPVSPRLIVGARAVCRKNCLDSVNRLHALDEPFFVALACAVRCAIAQIHKAAIHFVNVLGALPLVRYCHNKR